MTRTARRYLVRKSQSGRWLSYFLSPESPWYDGRVRLIYRIMGDHDSMRSAIDGIYE